MWSPLFPPKIHKPLDLGGLEDDFTNFMFIVYVNQNPIVY
jgi:hypothetical protein